MKLIKFEIKNFKNLSSISLEWDEILFLIGENNAGKSTVLQALELFLSGKQIKDRGLYRNEICDEVSAIEFIGHFTELTEEERLKPAVQGRMNGDKWILRKKFWLEVDGDKEVWEEQYFSYQRIELITGWPEQGTTWTNGWPDEFNELIAEVRTEAGHNRCNEATKELLRQKIRETRPELITYTNDWANNPGGGGSWKSNANSILPQFVYVPAVQDVSEETKAKDITTYGKIINLILERKLAVKPEVIALNEQLKRVQALFKPDAAHPEWTQAGEISQLETDITDKLSSVIQAQAFIEPKDIDLNAHILPGTVLKIDDGFKTDVPLQGHGLQRCLVITLLQILNDYSRAVDGVNTEGWDKRSVIFGIEEPEIYMHPHMLRRMKDVLMSLTAQDKYQVICTTHSPTLIDISDSHKNIVRFQKDANRNVSTLQVMTDIFSGTSAREERDRFRMILEFDPAVNELFFAKRVVLVEGDTEMAVFQKAPDLLSFFSADPGQKRDTTFINCHSKDLIPLFCRVLNHFQIDYLVVHDIDNSTDPDNALIASTVRAGTPVITYNPTIEDELGFSYQGRNKPLAVLNHFVSLVDSGSLPTPFTAKLRQIYGIP
ncbi:MAG: AAA family ATPase [Deltaproteobacteria bacterium]